VGVERFVDRYGNLVSRTRRGHVLIAMRVGSRRFVPFRFEFDRLDRWFGRMAWRTDGGLVLERSVWPANLRCPSKKVVRQGDGGFEHLKPGVVWRQAQRRR
jgi:hypothetical protein